MLIPWEISRSCLGCNMMEDMSFTKEILLCVHLCCGVLVEAEDSDCQFLSFHLELPGNWTQLARFGCKCLYLLSHWPVQDLILYDAWVVSMTHCRMYCTEELMADSRQKSSVMESRAWISLPFPMRHHLNGTVHAQTWVSWRRFSQKWTELSLPSLHVKW